MVVRAGLLVYLSPVANVVATGLWGPVASWRAHTALAHVIALATMLWGLALAAHEAVPCIGHAGAAPISWRCKPTGPHHPRVDPAVHVRKPLGIG